MDLDLTEDSEVGMICKDLPSEVEIETLTTRAETMVELTIVERRPESHFKAE